MSILVISEVQSLYTTPRRKTATLCTNPALRVIS